MLTIACAIGRHRLNRKHKREQARIDAFYLDTCAAVVRGGAL